MESRSWSSLVTEDLSLSSTLFRKEGTMLVTEEQINQFHEDGAILLKNAFREIALIDPNNKTLSTQVQWTILKYMIFLLGTINQFIFQSKVGGYSKGWHRGMKLYCVQEVRLQTFRKTWKIRANILRSWLSKPGRWWTRSNILHLFTPGNHRVTISMITATGRGFKNSETTHSILRPVW